MQIQQAARRLGVAAHVLRHWEDEGVLVPARAANGYRVYDEEALTRAQVVLGCRDAGLSLAQTRLVLHRDKPGRKADIRAQHLRVQQQLQDLERTRVFLEHVLGCRHSLINRCSECSRYAATAPTPEGEATGTTPLNVPRSNPRRAELQPRVCETTAAALGNSRRVWPLTRRSARPSQPWIRRASYVC